ncbi:phosphodiester glycosidase family protein [Weissella minor]|uniref:phosphodiester glycosidase family protein n=1 Tax=Weissella minor TaxID=1620 RepID=UPI001BAEBA63|nr:phosphodiester glycosidase family protein [Weissella minor]MBS0949204.1 phosphodiester glycosidase family protein [Weissella minor]
MKMKKPVIVKSQCVVQTILISSSIFGYSIFHDYGISANDQVKSLKVNATKSEILPKTDYSVKTGKSVNGSRMWNTQIKHAKMGVGFPNDEATNDIMSYETVPEFAKRHDLPVVSNASRFSYNATGDAAAEGKAWGERMHGGKVFAQNYKDSYSQYLTLNNDGKTLGSKPNSKKFNNGDYQDVLLGFFPLIENGKAVEKPIVPEKNISILQAQPRQIIYQLNDGSFGLITIGGRYDGDKGATYEEMIAELQKIQNVKFAYNLDGGGSSSTVIEGEMVNPVFDSRTPKGRPVGDFIYFYSDKLKDPVNSKLKSTMPDKPTATTKTNADGTAEVIVKGVTGATVNVKTTDGKKLLGTGKIDSNGHVTIKLEKGLEKSKVNITQINSGLTSEQLEITIDEATKTDSPSSSEKKDSSSSSSSVNSEKKASSSSSSSVSSEKNDGKANSSSSESDKNDSSTASSSNSEDGETSRYKPSDNSNNKSKTDSEDKGDSSVTPESTVDRDGNKLKSEESKAKNTEDKDVTESKKKPALNKGVKNSVDSMTDDKENKEKSADNSTTKELPLKEYPNTGTGPVTWLDKWLSWVMRKD